MCAGVKVLNCADFMFIKVAFIFFAINKPDFNVKATVNPSTYLKLSRTSEL